MRIFKTFLYTTVSALLLRKFELMMIFAPAEEDIVNLRRALARSKFLHPVYFDIERKLLKREFEIKTTYPRG